MASTRAPLVEKGLTSTMVEETAMAAMNPTGPTPVPACRNGTARGISEPRTAVEDAKAETTAPMKHSSRATSSGEARSATASPT